MMNKGGDVKKKMSGGMMKYRDGGAACK
jgi:hypothetical protein